MLCIKRPSLKFSLTLIALLSSCVCGAWVCVGELWAYTTDPLASGTPIPLPLEAYGDGDETSLISILAGRIAREPFNLVATLIFFLAILHTFIAPFFLSLSHKMQRKFRSENEEGQVSVAAEMLHFVGEVEVVFGLWVIVLLGAFAVFFDMDHAINYINQVNYTEPVFIVVIMTLAATRPILSFTRLCLGKIAALGGSTPLVWWGIILTISPIFGSFITEPAAMTVAALLLGKEFYQKKPSPKLKYATIGLLFVNISVGGTFTNFAAPPVLMVAQKWQWSTLFMLEHFAWKAAIGIVVSNLLYFAYFHKELLALGENKEEQKKLPVKKYSLESPWWVVLTHIAFMAWTVTMAHYVVFFVGGFLFFLGFYKATRHYQERLALQQALLVGFFLSGLVIHGGLQGWWIQPVLNSLTEHGLVAVSVLLTSFNDNASITYLASLIPDFPAELKYAVMVGALSGGGLTVIANAPNPAGQAILSKHFAMGRIHPFYLALGALIPTIIMSTLFMLL